MAKGKLFEYGVLYHPKEKKDANGNIEPQKSKTIVDITRIVAGSDKEVGMLAAKAIPKEYEEKFEDLEIIIRPF